MTFLGKAEGTNGELPNEISSSYYTMDKILIRRQAAKEAADNNLNIN